MRLLTFLMRKSRAFNKVNDSGGIPTKLFARATSCFNIFAASIGVSEQVATGVALHKRHI